MPPLNTLGTSHYVIAHRGGSAEQFENTIASFKNSVNNGVHVIETDVRMSQDGVIFVCHDKDFKRLFKHKEGEQGMMLATTDSD